jgi:septation ring formation regulator EzrA
MAKWSDEKMADLTRRLADTAIDYKQRCEELEAKLAKAVELLGQWRLASAGHVSLRSVIDKHDATLAELKGDTP